MINSVNISLVKLYLEETVNLSFCFQENENLCDVALNKENL